MGEVTFFSYLVGLTPEGYLPDPLLAVHLATYKGYYSIVIYIDISHSILKLHTTPLYAYTRVYSIHSLSIYTFQSSSINK